MALSVLVSRHPDDLTFANLPARTEAAIYSYVRHTFGVLFYGLIAVLPIIQDWTNFVVARSARTIIITLGALLAVWTVRQITSTLRAEKEATAARERGQYGDEETLTDSFVTGSINLWDRIWPTLAYVYIAVAYVASLANPNLIAELVGRATLLSALGLVPLLVGLRLMGLATQGLSVPLPRVLLKLLPTLQERVAGFVILALVLAGSAFCRLCAGVDP